MAYLCVGAAWPLSIYVVTIGAIAGHSIHVLPSGDLSVVDVPTGNAAWLSTAQAVVVPVLVVFSLAIVGRQAGADGERRQQLKWLMSGAAICGAGGAAALLIASLDRTSRPRRRLRSTCSASPSPRCPWASGWGS
jgi:hypothetical protein